MLIIADELIPFLTLDAIALFWMVLKILATHWIDLQTPPRRQKSWRKAG